MNWYFESLPFLQEEQDIGSGLKAKYGIKTRFYEAQALRRGMATPRHLELRNATKTLASFLNDFPEIFSKHDFGPDSKIGDTRTIIELAKAAPRLEQHDLKEQLAKFLSGQLSRRQMQAKLALMGASAFAGTPSIDKRLLQLLASEFSSLIGAASTRWLPEFDQHYFPVHAVGVSFVYSEVRVDAFIFAHNEGDLARLKAAEQICRTPFDFVWVVCPANLVADPASLSPYGVIAPDASGALKIYRNPSKREGERSREEELYRSLLSLVRRQ